MNNKKPMGIENPEQLKESVSDVKLFGNPDLFTLISKASSESQNWMKSTKAMEVGNGVVVQVTSDVNGNISDALTFVPDATIYTDETTGNRFIHAEQTVHKCNMWCDGDKPSDIESLLRNVTMLHEVATMLNSEKYTMEYLMKAYNVQIPELSSNNKPFSIPSFNDDAFDLSNCGVTKRDYLTSDLKIDGTGGEGFKDVFTPSKITDIETKHYVYIHINKSFLPKVTNDTSYNLEGDVYSDIIDSIVLAVKDLIVFDNEIKVNITNFSNDRKEDFFVTHSSTEGHLNGMDELVSEVQKFLNNASAFIRKITPEYTFDFKLKNLHIFDFESILNNAPHIRLKNKIEIGFSKNRFKNEHDIINLVNKEISRAGLDRNNIISTRIVLTSLGSNTHLIYGNTSYSNIVNKISDIVDSVIKNNPQLLSAL